MQWFLSGSFQHCQLNRNISHGELRGEYHLYSFFSSFLFLFLHIHIDILNHDQLEHDRLKHDRLKQHSTSAYSDRDDRHERNGGGSDGYIDEWHPERFGQWGGREIGIGWADDFVDGWRNDFVWIGPLNSV